MSLFKGKNQNQYIAPAQMLENRYKSSISNLLIVVAFTAVNIFLLVTNSNSYFLFSAYLPYFVADLAMYICGKYPAEYYYGDEIFYDNTYFALMLAFAVVILLVYVLCWFMARKKKVGWLIFGLVFFCLDTVAFVVLNGVYSEVIIDIIFHIWVIVSLAGGIATHKKIKKLAAQSAEPVYYENGTEDAEYLSVQSEGYITEAEELQQVCADSPVLRMADPDVKSRIFLETQAAGHYIVYRRVKKVNELIVDGRVYGEYEALVEMPHNLAAVVGGTTIEAGCGADSKMYININGETVAKKLRLV